MKIKRYIAILLCLFLLTANTLPVCAEEYQVRAPHMYAHSYAVMDANTGEILFGENVDKQIYPASTAKLMSAIVAVESGMPLDTIIETEGRIVNHTTPGTYNLGMNGGESYSLSALINMSLIASAADATDTMAVALYGSREAFAAKMMEKVEALGLTNTSFDNPVGSDIGGGFYGTYSTAREMCEITRYAMTNPTIRKIVRKASYTINGNGSQNGRTISNTNKFYSLYPYNSELFTIIGSKTGQTTAAGNVFIATAVDNDGHELICAYFGRDTKEETFRWINNLLTYAFTNYQEGNLDISKGAYNARYHKASTALIRNIDTGTFKQESDGTVDLQTVITENQAASMIKACFEPELTGTCLPSYFDKVVGSDTSCTKEFLTEALKTAVPGMQGMKSVNHYLDNLSGDLTLENVSALLNAGINTFDLYEMSYPCLKMRTWSPEDPMPFACTTKLPKDFITDFAD